MNKNYLELVKLITEALNSNTTLPLAEISRITKMVLREVDKYLGEDV